jgi:chromate transport protein ChrA
MTGKSFATIILGILGGLFGIGGALLTMGLGGLSGALGYEKAGEIIWRGVGAIILSIMGMIGAGIVGNHRRASATLMLLSSIIGFLIIYPLYIPASALFLSGGILALIGRKNEKPRSKET